MPVTLRYPAGQRVVRRSLLLVDSVQTIQLEGADRPAWIEPNDDELGYYRWSVPAAMLDTLASRAPAQLSVRERIGFVRNARALVDAGGLHGEQLLGILASFARDPDTDPQAAATRWAQLDRQLTDRAVFLPTVTPNEVDLLSRRAGNFQYNPVWGALIDQLWVR